MATWTTLNVYSGAQDEHAVRLHVTPSGLAEAPHVTVEVTARDGRRIIVNLTIDETRSLATALMGAIR